MNRFHNHLIQLLPPLLLLVLLCAGWEITVRAMDLPPWMLPSPSGIAVEMADKPALLFMHFAVTLREVILGFALGSVAGIILALAMASAGPLRAALQPLLVSSQTFPKEALAPLFIIWFGFGVVSKVFISALICFFPVAISCLRGLLSVSQTELDLFRLYGAGRLKILFKLRIPSALPQTFSGLRVASSLSVIGAVVGEFVGASKGLGHLIRVANFQLSTELIFASIVLLGLIGTGLYSVVVLTERLLSKRFPHLVAGKMV